MTEFDDCSTWDYSFISSWSHLMEGATDFCGSLLASVKGIIVPGFVEMIHGLGWMGRGFICMYTI